MASANNTLQPAVAKLRALLADKDKIIVCPGVYDGFTARIALREGFECLYMTGAGTTMSRLGMPDLGVATLNDMRDNAAMIAGLDPSVPVIADADTGYGGSTPTYTLDIQQKIWRIWKLTYLLDVYAAPLMVGRTVTQYIRAGVAALHLEDQVVTKRCGHLRNKELVSEDEYLARIRAAVNARTQSSGDIVLIARTDALESLGYDVAVGRLKKALALGADVAFLEGVTSREQARQVCQDLAPYPVLFNAVTGGVSPDLSVDEAKELGFRVIIFPGLTLGPVYEGVRKAVKRLKETGTQEPAREGAVREIFAVCGLKEAVEFDLAAGGGLYAGGV